MRDRRRLAVALLALGLLSVGLAQRTDPPLTAPLFDGVFIEEPYRFVQPPPGAAGGPLPVQVTEPVVKGAVDLMAVATGEVPPQAQIVAQADAFAVLAATTSIVVTIKPSALAGPPASADQRIVGNVYSVQVTDQAGALLQLRPGTVVTIILRAPSPNVVGQVARFDGTNWVMLPTEHGGLPDLFSANIEQLGEFAVVQTGEVASAGPHPSGSTAARSPAPSGGSGGGSGATNVIVILFAIAAVGAGLAWGILGDAQRRSGR
ncbi:MAG: hypothetical protein ABI578_04065 [Chloroflexota bacterium]